MSCSLRSVVVLGAVVALLGGACAGNDEVRSAVAASTVPAEFGPLAIVDRASGAQNQALAYGRVEISEQCVWVHQGTTRFMPVWPQTRTSWEPEGAILFSGDDHTTTIVDGDLVKLGGGSHISTPHPPPGGWVVAPHPDCGVVDTVFVVGDAADVDHERLLDDIDPGPADVEGFIDAMGAVTVDARLFQSLAEIEATSDLVIRAQIRRLEPGRVHWPRADQLRDPALVTVAFDVEILEVLGGNHPEFAENRFVVETDRRRELSFVEIAELIPHDKEMLFFLSDYTSPEGMAIEGTQDGTRYLFPLWQGWVIEHNDELVSVRGGIIQHAGYTSIDHVVAELRSLGE